MVTALAKIIGFIDVENLQPMKRWCRRFRPIRSNTYNVKLRAWIRRILGLVSGHDIVEMLKDVLNRREKEQLFEAGKKALKNMAECYKHTNLKKRHFFAHALKKSKISYNQARDYGFNISEKLWSTCENHESRNVGGGKPIDQELQVNLKEYLKEKSSIASNRLAKIKDRQDNNFGQKRPARYLEDNKSEIYKAFPLHGELKRSTFYRYVKKSGEFKNPHRLTDLCEYCEIWRMQKVSLPNELAEFDYAVQEVFDSKNAINYLQRKREQLILEHADLTRVNKLLNDLDNFETITFHRSLARVQRSSYQSHRTVEQLRNKILIEVDFKQKIKIGMGPRQVSAEYYEQQERSCLGFGIYHVQNDQVKVINFDLISSDLSDNSYSAVRGFRFLREQEFFKRIEQPHYIIWADCGYKFLYLKNQHNQDLKDDKKITTIAIALTKTDDERLVLENDRKIASCKILNVESFYNYRTIGPDFRLVTSVLSLCGEDETLSLNARKKYRNGQEVNLDENDYEQVVYKPSEEPKFPNRDEKSDSKISTLKRKKIRIMRSLDTIKSQKATHNKTINDDLATFMNLAIGNQQNANLDNQENEENDDNVEESGSDSHEDDDEDANNQSERNGVGMAANFPEFCRQEQRGKKKPCRECKAVCGLHMVDLLNPDVKKQPTQVDVNNELSAHGHPKSRKMDQGRLRITVEAIEELVYHYEFVHKIKRPRTELPD